MPRFFNRADQLEDVAIDVADERQAAPWSRRGTRLQQLGSASCDGGRQHVRDRSNAEWFGMLQALAASNWATTVAKSAFSSRSSARANGRPSTSLPACRLVADGAKNALRYPSALDCALAPDPTALTAGPYRRGAPLGTDAARMRRPTRAGRRSAIS